MIKHWKYLGKGVVFIALLLLCVTWVNKKMVPKGYLSSSWPTTTTYRGLYEMEKNTVDMIVLGSSHAVAGYNPQAAYDAYGVRSYNLGCAQQNIVVSYYWLKEALRYQSPSVVVLDTYMVFQYDGGEPLNTSEESTRAAIDAMKWSANKYAAVRDICRLDEKQSMASYVLTNLRYHSRWKEMGVEDFVPPSAEELSGIKGFAPLGGKCGIAYAPFVAANTESIEEMHPIMKEYLDRIVELCRNEDIKLVLIKTPTTSAHVGRYNAINEYARSNGIDYIDYNEKSVYEKLNLDFGEDMADASHANVWGAEKISIDLAYKMNKVYGYIKPAFDAQWDCSREYCAAIMNDYQLQYETDFVRYLSCMNPRYETIFIAISGDGRSFMNDDIATEFRRLGLKAGFDTEESYAAVVTGNTIREESSSTQAVVLQGKFADGTQHYEVTSEGGLTGRCFGKVKLNGIERARDWYGINIVVYSNTLSKVISVSGWDGSMHQK